MERRANMLSHKNNRMQIGSGRSLKEEQVLRPEIRGIFMTAMDLSFSSKNSKSNKPGNVWIPDIQQQHMMIDYKEEPPNEDVHCVKSHPDLMLIPLNSLPPVQSNILCGEHWVLSSTVIGKQQGHSWYLSCTSPGSEKKKDHHWPVGQRKRTSGDVSLGQMNHDASSFEQEIVCMRWNSIRLLC